MGLGDLLDDVNGRIMNFLVCLLLQFQLEMNICIDLRVSYGLFSDVANEKAINSEGTAKF
jgi:hypothetical protein